MLIYFKVEIAFVTAHFSVFARQHLSSNLATSMSRYESNRFIFHLKALVYKAPVEDVNDMRNHIIDIYNVIRNTPDVFERVRQYKSIAVAYFIRSWTLC